MAVTLNRGNSSRDGCRGEVGGVAVAAGIAAGVAVAMKGGSSSWDSCLVMYGWGWACACCVWWGVAVALKGGSSSWDSCVVMYR